VPIKMDDGRFYPGIMCLPGKGTTLIGPGCALGERTMAGSPDYPITTEVKQGGWGRWRYCEECYRHVLPYSLLETSAYGITNTCVCSVCGYGIDQTSVERVRGRRSRE